MDSTRELHAFPTGGDMHSAVCGVTCTVQARQLCPHERPGASLEDGFQLLVTKTEINCCRHECRSYGAHMAAWRCDLDGSGSAVARALHSFSSGGSGCKHSGTCGGVAEAARDFSEL